MQKILFILSIAFSLHHHSAAQDTGIVFFKGSWQEAQDAARKENKMIFVDCNTTWCGPCKELAKNIFPQKRVGDYYNAHFINVSMDMEKGIGPQLRNHYGVKAYPTMLYLKPGGYQIDQTVGYKDADSLLLVAKEAVGSSDSVSIYERFDKGPRDTALLRAFFLNLVATAMPGSQNAAFDTIARQEGYAAFLQPKYWDILAIADVSSPVGLWFAGHREEFEKKYGADVVNGKIATMYFNRRIFSSLFHFYSQDTTIFTKFKKSMEDRNLPDLAFMNGMVDFLRFCKVGNFEKGFAAIDAVVANGKVWQYHLLAIWADWMTVGVTQYRYRAAKWAGKAAEMTEDKAVKDHCIQIADDLLNNITPSWNVYPSPKVYGINF